MTPRFGLVAALLVGVLVAAGCGRASRGPAGPTPAETRPSRAAATDPAPGSSNAQLGPIIFALGESNTQPVGRSDRFEAGVKTVYAFFNFTRLRTGDIVTGTWFRGTEQLGAQHYKMSEVFGDTPREKGHLWMHIAFDDGAPPGSYRLEIRVNDRFAQSGSFAIDPK